MLTSTLVREASLSSEQWWTWTHGCTKHREKVMGKGSALNKSRYMKLSKPQGTLQKRGQKECKIQDREERSHLPGQDRPLQSETLPHAALNLHKNRPINGQAGIQEELRRPYPYCWNIEPVDSKWRGIIVFSTYSLMTLPGSSRQSQPNDQTNGPG